MLCLFVNSKEFICFFFALYSCCCCCYSVIFFCDDSCSRAYLFFYLSHPFLSFSKPHTSIVSYFAANNVVFMPATTLLGLATTVIISLTHKGHVHLKNAIELLQKSWIGSWCVWATTVECIFKLKRNRFKRLPIASFFSFLSHCMRSLVFAVVIYASILQSNDNHD